jgi:hypothetical protein
MRQSVFPEIAYVIGIVPADIESGKAVTLGKSSLTKAGK